MKCDRLARQTLDSKKMTFQFKATEQEVIQIAVNAIRYSRPLGLGYLEALKELDIKLGDIDLEDGILDLDYVAGRCVKLFIRNIGGEMWEIAEHPTRDYQTWVGKYPTNEALVESVIKGDRLQNFPTEEFPAETFPPESFSL